MIITIETAIEIGSAQKDALEAKLNSLNDQIKFVYQINPQILGGLRITTPTKILDLSLSAQLNELNRSLLQSVSQ